MKNAFIRSKNSTENLMDDRQITPSEHAEDKVMYAAEDISHDAAHLAGSGVRTAANKGKEAFQRHRAEKAAEDLRQRSSGTEPQATTQTVPEQPQPTTTVTNPITVKQSVNSPEIRSDYGSRPSPPVQYHPPQVKSRLQGYQLVSSESGTTLYSDADRMVEQGRQLAKKKAKQNAETGRQITQQTDRIAHSAERTVKTAEVPTGIHPSGETIRAAERPAHSIEKAVQSVNTPVRGADRSARTAKQTHRAAQKSICS